MPLPTSLKRGLSFGKSSEQEPQYPRSKPSAPPTQSSASALQRAMYKSTFLYGPAPPTTGTPTPLQPKLTSEQVGDLLYMLAQPVSTPMLTTSIANLKSPISRHSKSCAAVNLCEVHTWLELRWIDELTDVIGEEIGPQLSHLRSAPSWLTSTETKEILGMLEPYAHIFPAPDPDGSRMANPYACYDPKCEICLGMTCKACKLSMFFQNAEAVKALNVCAKGRKRGGRAWPVSCAWLDPLPSRIGWQMAWRKEGLPILSDRRIARRWRRSGRQEGMTEEMRNVQGEVIADRDALSREFDKVIRRSVKSALVDSDSVVNEITERQWTLHEAALNPSMIALLKKLGMQDDEDYKKLEPEMETVPWARSYEMLIGIHPSTARGSICHVDVEHNDPEEQVRCNGLSDPFVNSYITMVEGPLQLPTNVPLVELPCESIYNSQVASTHSPPSAASRPVSSISSIPSTDSWEAPAPHSPNATSSGVSRDSWAYFNASPLGKANLPSLLTHSMPSRSKLNLIEQAEHSARYSTPPVIPAKSPKRGIRDLYGAVEGGKR